MSATSQYTTYEHNYLTQINSLIETAVEQRIHYANVHLDKQLENMWALRVEQLKEKEADITYEIEKRIATKISEYKVICSNDYDKFIDLVSESIKVGWVPSGHFHTVIDTTENGEKKTEYYNYYFQPMVKYS